MCVCESLLEMEQPKEEVQSSLEPPPVMEITREGEGDGQQRSKVKERWRHYKLFSKEFADLLHMKKRFALQ